MSISLTRSAMTVSDVGRSVKRARTRLSPCRIRSCTRSRSDRDTHPSVGITASSIPTTTMSTTSHTTFSPTSNRSHHTDSILSNPLFSPLPSSKTDAISSSISYKSRISSRMALCSNATTSSAHRSPKPQSSTNGFCTSIFVDGMHRVDENRSELRSRERVTSASELVDMRKRNEFEVLGRGVVSNSHSGSLRTDNGLGSPSLRLRPLESVGCSPDAPLSMRSANDPDSRNRTDRCRPLRRLSRCSTAVSLRGDISSLENPLRLSSRGRRGPNNCSRRGDNQPSLVGVRGLGVAGPRPIPREEKRSHDLTDPRLVSASPSHEELPDSAEISHKDDGPTLSIGPSESMVLQRSTRWLTAA
mmetsp:Transcript_11928/g.29175  ORF Transcript_11928/g.29175 Transcript_11928/m.29175 type:complete len:359 (+) Transcript_11928:457-1533(+)